MGDASRTAPDLGGMERHHHICVFHGGKDEEYRVLSRFIREGFPRGDRAVHIIDGAQRADHVRRLAELGVDVASSEARGQLEIRGWDQAHLRPGWFDQHAMVALVEGVLEESRSRGFGFTRWVANMGWALQDVPGVSDLVEYCTRLNDVVPKHRATIVCTYDVTRFSASSVMDVLRSHPVAIVGGIVHENPYFAKPGELIRELRTRKALPVSGRPRAPLD